MINEVVAFNRRVGPKGPALVRFLVIKKKKKLIVAFTFTGAD
jgi:hypothetical protein